MDEEKRTFAAPAGTEGAPLRETALASSPEGLKSCRHCGPGAMNAAAWRQHLTSEAHTNRVLAEFARFSPPRGKTGPFHEDITTPPGIIVSQDILEFDDVAVAVESALATALVDVGDLHREGGGAAAAIESAPAAAPVETGAPSLKGFEQKEEVAPADDLVVEPLCLREDPSLTPPRLLRIDLRGASCARTVVSICARAKNWTEFSDVEHAGGSSTLIEDAPVCSSEHANLGGDGLSVDAEDTVAIHVTWLADQCIKVMLAKCLRAVPPKSRSRVRCWVNHFPGCSAAVTKVSLGKKLNRVRELLEKTNKAFDFYPKTFLLPCEQKSAADYLEPNSRIAMHPVRQVDLKTLIVKPSASSQGKGIVLIQNPLEVRAFAEEAKSQVEVGADDPNSFVAQEYLSDPLLKGKLKVSYHVRDTIIYHFKSALL